MVAATSHQRMSSSGLQRKLYAYRARQGQTLVPPANAKAHLLALTALGWSQSQIEAATGVARCALKAILNSTCRKIHWATQQRILALPIQPPSPRHGFPSHGAVRRLQALYAIGHPLDVIAAHVGRAPTFLSDVVNGRKPFISSATAADVRRAYDELGMTVGPSVRAQRRAKRCQWAAPLYWDDERIDDPAGFPDWTGHCGSPDGWLLHAVDQEKPCAACLPHLALPEDLRGVPKLAERFPEALAVIAESEKTWAQAGAAIGVSDYMLRKAHAEVRARHKDQPAVALAA